MLKDPSMRNCSGSYLMDRNVLFEDTSKNLKKGLKLPSLGSSQLEEREKFQEFNEETYIKNLRNCHKKELDMKEKDPKFIEQRKESKLRKVKAKMINDSFSIAGRDSTIGSGPDDSTINSYMVHR